MIRYDARAGFPCPSVIVRISDLQVSLTANKGNNRECCDGNRDVMAPRHPAGIVRFYDVFKRLLGGGWRVGCGRSIFGRVMRVTVNGNEHSIPDGLTVRGLLDHLGLTEGPVAVERNRNVVPRSEHSSAALYDEDVLEIVHFVGGG